MRALGNDRDEAGAGKIEWGEGICPPTAAASALRSVIVWGGMRARDAADGGKACWEAGAGKNKLGRSILPANAISGRAALGNGLIAGGNRAWDVADGGEGVWEAGAGKNEWGAGHLPTNAISGRAALGNGLGRESPAGSVHRTW